MVAIGLSACNVALSGEASQGKEHHAHEVQQAHDWCSIPALLTTRERLEKHGGVISCTRLYRVPCQQLENAASATARAHVQSDRYQ